MFTAQDVAQLKSLLANEQKTKEDYARVLEIRTKERDELYKRVPAQSSTNVVYLTPEIILRERREAANSIIKVAMRKISKELGTIGPLRKILEGLIDED
jgi:hypothetical protein